MSKKPYTDPTSEMLHKLAHACECNGYALTVTMMPRAKVKRVPGALKVEGAPRPANRPRWWRVHVQRNGGPPLWASHPTLKAAAESVRAQLRNSLKDAA